MMVKSQGVDVGGIGEFNALLPGRVTKACIARIFLIGIHGIVNHYIRAANKIRQCGIERARTMLDIADIADGFLTESDPEASRAARMIEQNRFYNDFTGKGKRVAGGEVMIGDIGLESGGIDGEIGRANEAGAIMVRSKPMRMTQTSPP